MFLYGKGSYKRSDACSRTSPRLWKTTGADSAAALALEEFGQAGSLEAARSATAVLATGFRAAGLEATRAAWAAHLLAGCRGSSVQLAHPVGDGLPAMFRGLPVSPHRCSAQFVPRASPAFHGASSVWPAGPRRMPLVPARKNPAPSPDRLLVRQCIPCCSA